MAAFILTIRLSKNPEHNPHDKKTGKCPLSDYCTDVTGEHHSGLVLADTEKYVRDRFSAYHITRIERV